MVAAALFWLSWALMPGVGITDAARILELVGQHAARVRASVAAQLLSAALYAPALVGIVATRRLRRVLAVRIGAILLAIGAMGSAADAVFHLLAAEMVAPGVDRAADAAGDGAHAGRRAALHRAADPVRSSSAPRCSR